MGRRGFGDPGWIALLVSLVVCLAGGLLTIRVQQLAAEVGTARREQLELRTREVEATEAIAKFLGGLKNGSGNKSDSR